MANRHRWSLLIPLLLGLLVIAVRSGQASAASTLLINEVLVGNASTNLDPEHFNFSQWIEVRNVSANPISLRNYSVRSLPDGAAEWQSITLPLATDTTRTAVFVAEP